MDVFIHSLNTYCVPVTELNAGKVGENQCLFSVCSESGTVGGPLARGIIVFTF